MPRGIAQSGSCIAMQYTRTTPYCQSKCRLGNIEQRRVSGDKNGITGHASATRELFVEAENIERGIVILSIGREVLRGHGSQIDERKIRDRNVLCM